MQRVRRAVLVGATVAVVGAVPAQASDAGLRKVVKREEARILPRAKAFHDADAALTAGSNTDSASAAAGLLRSGLRGYKHAVTPIKTESATSKAGKKKLLQAIRELDIGLVDYQKLIDQIKAGASQDSLKATLISLNKRIAAAGTHETQALKLIGASR